MSGNARERRRERLEILYGKGFVGMLSTSEQTHSSHTALPVSFGRLPNSPHTETESADEDRPHENIGNYDQNPCNPSRLLEFPPEPLAKRMTRGAELIHQGSGIKSLREEQKGQYPLIDLAKPYE